jgi:hypothetical protein
MVSLMCGFVLADRRRGWAVGGAVRTVFVLLVLADPAIVPRLLLLQAKL